MTRPFRTLVGAISLSATFTLSGCSSDPLDPNETLTGPTWVITNRVQNAGEASLPDCAKDDTLEFTQEGTFISLIGGTQCNPNERDVPGAKYTWSDDKKAITFDSPGFSYTAKIIELTKEQLIIEFDLGPGFLIRDTMKPKK